MSRAIRILLLAVAVFVTLALFFPQMGLIHAPAHPLAFLLVALLLAFLWPSTRKAEPLEPAASDYDHVRFENEPHEDAARRGDDENTRLAA